MRNTTFRSTLSSVSHHLPSSPGWERGISRPGLAFGLAGGAKSLAVQVCCARAASGENLRHGLELEGYLTRFSQVTRYAAVPCSWNLTCIPRNEELLTLRQPIMASLPLGHIQTQVHRAHNYPGIPSCEGLPFQGAPTLSSRASFLNTCTERAMGGRGIDSSDCSCPTQPRKTLVNYPSLPPGPSPRSMARGTHQGNRRLFGRR